MHVLDLRTFILLVGLSLFTASAGRSDPLVVMATTPDLASLAGEIGGDEVAVTSFTVGVQDPHFLEPRPSFIRKLAGADLYLQVGAGLELGWAPTLVRSARNRAVLPGQPGFLDISGGVEILRLQAARVDRSLGDVHPDGNPHYLLDPENGSRAAGLVLDRLSTLRPERAEAFSARHADWLQRLADARERWAAMLLPFSGAEVVVDHNLWLYFARRFGIEVREALEPLPGVPPSSRHLLEVVNLMRTEQIGVILSTPYFDRRHAERVAEQTGARIADMAHQVGAREGTGDYIAMLDHNVRALHAALTDQ